jgi:serine/threonine-protein kinase RsbW
VSPSATPSRGGERGADPPDEPPRLQLVVYAEPAAVPIVRHSLREWLETLAWPEPDLDDVLIAVNEACTNAIEHAYPPENLGYVTIDGNLGRVGDERYVTVIVRDRGQWRPAPEEPGFRGYGITVMRGCMHTVNIEPNPDGTSLTLISFAVPG